MKFVQLDVIHDLSKDNLDKYTLKNVRLRNTSNYDHFKTDQQSLDTGELLRVWTLENYQGTGLWLTLHQFSRKATEFWLKTTDQFL